MKIKIYNDIKEAIQAASQQNRERDIRVGLEPDDISVYEEEATYLMEETGENYFPDYPDHPHIVYKNGK